MNHAPIGDIGNAANPAHTSLSECEREYPSMHAKAAIEPALRPAVSVNGLRCSPLLLHCDTLHAIGAQVGDTATSHVVSVQLCFRQVLFWHTSGSIDAMKYPESHVNDADEPEARPFVYVGGAPCDGVASVGQTKRLHVGGVCGDQIAPATHTRFGKAGDST
jgi:hypothetical protein